MSHDTSATKIHQIDGLGEPIGFGRLAAPLARGNNGHRLITSEHRREERFDRADDRVVGLPEFVLQAVDVEVIHAGEAPEFLVSGELYAELRATGVHPPTVAMAVNR